MPRSSSTTAPGIALCDMTCGTSPKQHIHFRGEEDTLENSWVITSDVPLQPDSILSMEPLSTPLPGRLGSYLLPRDAVLHWPHRKQTTIMDFQTLLQNERQSFSIATTEEDPSYQVAVCGEEEEEEDVIAPSREQKDDDEDVEEEEDYDDDDEPSDSEDPEEPDEEKGPEKDEWLESDEEGDPNDGPLCGAVVNDPPPARSTRSSSRRR